MKEKFINACILRGNVLKVDMLISAESKREMYLVLQAGKSVKGEPIQVMCHAKDEVLPLLEIHQNDWVYILGELRDASCDVDGQSGLYVECSHLELLQFASDREYSNLVFLNGEMIREPIYPENHSFCRCLFSLHVKPSVADQPFPLACIADKNIWDEDLQILSSSKELQVSGLLTMIPSEDGVPGTGFGYLAVFRICRPTETAGSVLLKNLRKALTDPMKMSDGENDDEQI